MVTTMRRVVLASGLSVFAVLGCIDVPESVDRCAELRADLETCIGTANLPLDCAQLGDGDLDRIEQSVDLCAELSGILPTDGDPQSAACRALGFGCVSPLTPAPVFQPTKYPVVFVNGIDTSPLFNWSDRIVQVLREDAGVEVHLATLAPYQPPHKRAPQLWQRVQEIRAETGAEKVNLICHSLGGLDCRYLVSPGGLHWEVAADHATIASSVASITTVGTAHQGTPVAAQLLGALSSVEQQQAVAAYAAIVGDWFSAEALASDPDLRASIAALTPAQAEAFNLEIVDAEGVDYQSWAGFSAPFGAAPASYLPALEDLCGPGGLSLFGGAHDYMSLALAPFYEAAGKSNDGELAPNDGLAPVASTAWGTFRGCIPADHQEQLGKQNLPDVNVRTGLDIAWFYALVARDLAERGK